MSQTPNDRIDPLPDVELTLNGTFDAARRDVRTELQGTLPGPTPADPRTYVILLDWPVGMINDPSLNLRALAGEVLHLAAQAVSCDVVEGSVTETHREPMVWLDDPDDEEFPVLVGLWMLPNPKPEPDTWRIRYTAQVVRRAIG